MHRIASDEWSGNSPSERHVPNRLQADGHFSPVLVLSPVNPSTVYTSASYPSATSTRTGTTTTFPTPPPSATPRVPIDRTS